MKKLQFSLLLALIGSYSLPAQNQAVSYTSPAFRSLELKLGVGNLVGKEVTLGALYQRNFRSHLAAVSYTDLGFSPKFSNRKNAYLFQQDFHLVQALGIGATLGRKGLNGGCYLVGGGRYVYSRITAQELLKPRLVTSRILPELAVLIDLKAGRKQVYGCFQLYYPLFPFAMGVQLETNFSVGAGVGIRLAK